MSENQDNAERSKHIDNSKCGRLCPVCAGLDCAGTAQNTRVGREPEIGGGNGTTGNRDVSLLSVVVP
eukprot:2638097-Rhodomonas_salina.1